MIRTKGQQLGVKNMHCLLTRLNKVSFDSVTRIVILGLISFIKNI